MSSATEDRRFSRSVVVWASIVIIVAGMRASASLVVPLLLSLFLAILCGPPLEWLIRRGLRRSLAMLLVMSGLCFVVLVLAQVLATTARAFIEAWPETYQPKAEQIADDWGDWVQTRTKTWLPASLETDATDSDDPKSPDEAIVPTDAPVDGVTDKDVAEDDASSDPRLTPGAATSRSHWNDWIEPDFLMRSFTFGMRAVSGILSQAVLILITTIFLLIEATSLPNKLEAISDDAPARLEKLQRIAQEVNQYMAIKTSTSLLTGAVVALVLWLLEVDFALLWGMTAFLLNFVPNIGSFIAAVPAVLLTLLQHNWQTAALVVGLYVAVNMFVGYYLEPKWMGRGLGLSTLVVFISLVFWGWVLGPVGMVISVPLTMAAKIALEGSPETRWLAILMGPGVRETATITT